MKKELTLLGIITILILQTCSFGYGYESVLVKSDDSQEVLTSKKAPENSEKTELLNFLEKNKIYTVQDYAQWLEKNIHYQQHSDNVDWASWRLTLNRGYGDCKNISALNAKILETLGYKPMLIGYKNSSEGHVFTVFFKNGTLNLFDNISYHVTNAKTIDEIGLFLYQKYNIEMVFQVHLNPTTFQLLYTRAMLAKISKNLNNT